MPDEHCCANVVCLQEGASTTEKAKQSAQALKEKTKETAAQSAEGLRDAAGSDVLMLSDGTTVCSCWTQA